jgi:MFS family permease
MARASLVKRLATPSQWRSFLIYDRNIYLLLLFTLGKGFQLSIAAVSVNLYVASLGYGIDFVGVVAAMPALGSLLAAVPIGMIADRIGRKPLLVWSGFLNPLSLVAIGLSTSAPFLIGASLLNGFLSSAYWVTNLPILTESTSEDQRVGVLALNNFLLLGVGALGGLIGGVVPEFVSSIVHQPADSVIPLRFSVLAAALVVFIPAIPLVFLREERRAKLRQRPTPEATPDLAAAGAEASVVDVPDNGVPNGVPMRRGAISSLFAKLLVPDMLFTTGEGAVVQLLQVYFVLRFGIAVGTVGVIYTVAGLVGGATSLAAPRFVRRFGQLRMATTMQYITAPVMLVIGFSPLFPIAAAAEFARQMLRGLFEPTYAAFAMGRVSSRYRATLSGFYSVTWSIGYSIGPITAGFLQEHVNLSAGFIVGPVCLLISASLLRLFFGSGEDAPSLP